MRGVWPLAGIAVLLASCGGPLVQTTPLPYAVGRVSYWPERSVPQKVLGYYALPRAMVPLRVTQADCKINIAFDPPVFVPDQQYRYAVLYSPSATSDDSFSIQIDKTGLLSGINSTSETRVNEIAATAINLAGSITKAVAALAEPPDEKCDPKTKREVSRLFDPADDKSFETARQEIADEFRELKLTLHGDTKYLDGGGAFFVDGKKKLGWSQVVASECLQPSTDATLRREGICYRPPATFSVKVDATSSLGSVNRVFIVSAPDRNQVFYIPIDRKLFAKFDVKMTFDQGMLKSFESTDKSEVLAALQLPSTVVKAILGLDSGAKK